VPSMSESELRTLLEGTVLVSTYAPLVVALIAFAIVVSALVFTTNKDEENVAISAIAHANRMRCVQIYRCIANSNVRSHLHAMKQVDTTEPGWLLLCC